MKSNRLQGIIFFLFPVYAKSIKFERLFPKGIKVIFDSRRVRLSVFN